MAKRQMSAQHKRAMQMGRVKGRVEKEAALEALANPQFQNPRFWRNVDPEVLAGVKKAIDAAHRIIKREMASLLEPELVKERDRLASLQEQQTAAKARIKKLQGELNKLGGK